MPQVAVGALLRGDDVLLCFRTAQRSAYPAVWDFAGGHVEPGETPLAALSRELFEELGVVAQVALLPETPDLRIMAGDLDLSLWAVRAWEGQPANRAPEEHDRVQWFGLEDATAQRLSQPAYRTWLTSLVPHS